MPRKPDPTPATSLPLPATGGCFVLKDGVLKPDPTEGLKPASPPPENRAKDGAETEA